MEQRQRGGALGGGERPGATARLPYAEFVIAALSRAGFVGHHLAVRRTVRSMPCVELSPVAVILDVILPDTTGYEICKRVAAALRRRFADRVRQRRAARAPSIASSAC